MPTTYTCPILGCPWTHRDDGPAPLPADATDDDTNAQAVLHDATINHALRTHYETHGVEEWAALVGKLQGELRGRQVLVCVGCLSDRWQAEQAARGTGGAPLGPVLPPLNPALTVVDGNAICRAHLSFGPPPIPGRTPGGLVLGNTPLPKTGL